MYKQDLELDHLQGLIHHKHNQPYIYIYTHTGCNRKTVIRIIQKY